MQIQGYVGIVPVLTVFYRSKMPLLRLERAMRPSRKVEGARQGGGGSDDVKDAGRNQAQGSLRPEVAHQARPTLPAKIRVFV